MLDRVPVNPGRVLITPENGSAAYYATMTRADNPTQEGTPLNKASLLKDATAALFGLGTDAVPDDVFAFLGQYNQHTWKRRAVAGSYALVKGDVVAASISNYDSFVCTGAYNTTVSDVSYADSVEVDDSGNISLVNPSTVSVSNIEYNNASVLAGKYFKKELRNGAGNIVVTQYAYVPVGSTPSAIGKAGDVTGSNGGVYFGSAYAVGMAQQIVTAEYTEEYGEWEFVVSADRNAHPDNGVENGYEYQYCGIPFENAAQIPVKIATGSYIGTGTYGSGNKNSLTFDFEPKFLLIVQNGTYGSSLGFFFNGNTVLWFFGTDATKKNTASLSSGTLTWYTPETSSADYYQLNSYGESYNYIAIG